tara:strand:- start:45 stop:326 length:282 start_codon:yes stop_codon:yes gene_type:complete
MPKIVLDDGFVIGWGPRTKKECDELWERGLNGAPVSSPSLSLSTKEMRSDERSERGKGDPGVSRPLEPDQPLLCEDPAEVLKVVADTTILTGE